MHGSSYANLSATSAENVRTPSLDVVYLRYGPPGGETVLMVHGFPDDARTWDVMAHALAGDGYSVIVPYVRGFGATRLREGAARTGEIAALARDAIELLDALELDKVHFVGHDWGARAGYGVAVLAPERLRSLCSLAVPYSPKAASEAMSVAQTRAYWYQWYFATSRGAQELEEKRRAFCRELWRTWSPAWAFQDDEYGRTADSFENADFVEVVLTSYRQRWNFIEGEPHYAQDRARLSSAPPISVATLTLMGRDDGATLLETARDKDASFAGPYRCETIDGSGHFIQRERPQEALALLRPHLAGAREPARG